MSVASPPARRPFMSRVVSMALIALFTGCIGQSNSAITSIGKDPVGGDKGDTGGGVEDDRCPADPAPGHVSIHRLTNDEYDNTVADLLGTHGRPAATFAPTGPSYSGYSND